MLLRPTITPERKLKPRSTRASTLMVTSADGVMLARQANTPLPSARLSVRPEPFLRPEDSSPAAAGSAGASGRSSEAKKTDDRRSRSLFFFALEEELR